MGRSEGGALVVESDGLFERHPPAVSAKATSAAASPASPTSLRLGLPIGFDLVAVGCDLVAVQSWLAWSRFARGVRLVFAAAFGLLSPKATAKIGPQISPSLYKISASATLARSQP